MFADGGVSTSITYPAAHDHTAVDYRHVTQGVAAICAILCREGGRYIGENTCRHSKDVEYT